MGLKNGILCLLFLSLSVTSIGQNSNLKFKSITSEDGLSQGIITAIIEDSKGIMWVGTRNGLNRMIGKTIQRYPNPDSESLALPSVQISCLTEGLEGKLWIGFYDASLCCLNTRTNEIFIPDFIDQNGNSISEAYISRITFQDEENLWASAGKHGLFHLNLLTKKSKVYPVYPPSNPEDLLTITDLFFDRGELWLSTLRKGVVRFDPGNGVVKHLWKENPTNFSHFNEAIRIIPGEYPWIWVGTKQSFLNKVNRKTGEFKAYDTYEDVTLHHRTILDMLLEGEDSLWLATTVGGLQLFHIEEERLELVSSTKKLLGIAYNGLNVLYRSSDNILWAGTNGKGLSYHHPGTNIFDVYSKSKPAEHNLDFESVRSVYSDDDWIFVGGYFGLNRINRKTGKRDYLMKTWVPYSFCEVEDDSNLLLIGTEGISLHVINKQNGFVRSIEMEDMFYDERMLNLLEFVYCIIHYQGSQYLFGHSGGLALIDIDSNKILQNYSNSDDPNSIVSGEIKSLLRDSEGQIWVGSISGGLAKFLPEKGSFIRINSNNGFNELPNNVILDLHQDLAGNIWVATSMGLCKMNSKTGLEKIYTVADGLSGNLIYAIEEGQTNMLWCSSSEGLSRIDTETGNILNFNSRHGLPGNELNRGASFKGEDGILYFGGIDGLVSFSSNQAMIEFPKPKPQIVKFFLYNEEAKLDTLLPYTKEVTIEPGQKYFSFEVTGTDYILDEENYFQYNIPEIKDTWIDIQGARRISITDPDPGTYHLNVRVSNNQQFWVEMETPLIIRVIPKLYQTMAAKVLMLLFAVSMLILGVLLRTRYLIIKQAELNRLVDLRTSELRKSELQLREANASKDRFFSIIAHDLKSPFNSLLGLSELLSEEWDEYSDKEKKRMISIMQENLSNTYKLLVNLLDWSRLQRKTILADLKDTDLRKLVENTIDGFKVQIASKRIVVSNQVESDHIAMADPFMVETIYRNLIFNAIKFTPTKGQITLTTELENDQIKCCVSDTGIGMSEEMQIGLFKLDESQSRPGTDGEKGTGLGLLVCREFIHLMGGEIEVTSREGEGSSFCFLLSKKR